MNESLLKKITAILIETAQNGDVIEYSQVSRKINDLIPPLALNTPLGEISIRCIRAGYPPLSVLVVNKDTRMPGEGFFTWVAERMGYPNLPEKEWEDFFNKQVNRTYRMNNWDHFLDHFSDIKLSNTWIFQGNPQRFMINEYLIENEQIWWTVNQEHYLNDMGLNDQVFIWRSDGGEKGTGGIVARGLICGEPKRVKSHPTYWLKDNGNSEDKAKLQIPIKLLEVQVSGNYLKRTSLLNHPLLKDLLVLKVANSTNYKVELHHAIVLQELWMATFKANKEQSFNEITFNTSFDKREYLNSKNSSFYILTIKRFLETESKSSYSYEVLIVKNNTIIERKSISNPQKKGLLSKAKKLGLKLLLKVDSKITLDHVSMVHYKQDRPGARKWVNETEDDLANRFHRILLHTTVKLDIEQEMGQDDSYYKEGKKISYHGNRYERNAKNRLRAIEIHGVDCKGCGFNFEEVYGEIGKDFIEVHHLHPLSNLEGEEIEVNPQTDLIPLCANCHRIVHRKKDGILTIEELRNSIRKLQSTF